MINNTFKKIYSCLFIVSLCFLIHTPNIIVEDCTNGVVSTEVFSNLTQYMKLKASLYKIHIIYDKVNTLEKYSEKESYVAGTIDYYDKNIYVTKKENNEKTEHILYHEIGHIMDEYDESDGHHDISIRRYSSTSEFKKIFEQEKNSISEYSKEKFFKKQIDEYFAECIAIYVEQPDKLKEFAPLTYEYLDKILNLNIYNGPITTSSISHYKQQFARYEIIGLNQSISYTIKHKIY